MEPALQTSTDVSKMLHSVQQSNFNKFTINVLAINEQMPAA